MSKKNNINIYITFFFILIITFIPYFQIKANWYNMDINYYKIITTKDGIAKIELEQLLKIAPELNGKTQDGLHIIYKGNDYPFYYKGDDNINKNAEIYFYGHRVSGDSTYFNHYTNEAVFFLYYDINKQPNRIVLLEESNNITDHIEKVKYNYHIEKDIDYYFGYDVLNIEADRFEKWYWQILNDYPGGKAKNTLKSSLFQSNFFYPTYLNDNENISLIANFSTAFTDPKPDPRYKRCIKVMLNTDTVYSYNFDSLFDNKQIILPLKNFNLFSGINQLSILNSTADTFNTELGIDFYEIIGYGKPRAFNSQAVFEIDENPNNREIEISGFLSKNIVLIDTTSNFILFKNGYGITKINANVNNGATPFISLMINDETHTYNYPGFHIGILRPNSNFSEFQSSKQMGKEIENLLPGITDGTIIVIAYNGEMDIPLYLRTWLLNNGATKIKNIKPGENYICIFKFNDITTIKEFTEQNGLAYTGNYNFISAEVIFEDENANAYSINYKLPANPNFNYTLHISDSLNIENAKVLQTHKTALQTINNNGADMIIITHPQFYNAANQLAEYRRNQGYRIELVNIDDIYKEFSYGIKTPFAIKDFLKFAYNSWKEPKVKYALLIGDASRDPNKNNPTSIATDYIPSYGIPISDYWYGLLKDNKTTNAEIIVGRIPASSDIELLNYLEKIKSYENTMPLSWHKNVLFLNGGLTAEEQKKSKNDSYYFGDLIVNYPICADTFRITKTDFIPSGETQKNEIISAINSGQILTLFNGHASPEVFDMDGWQAQNLNNKDKYGTLATLSCNSGAFAEPSFIKCRNEEYLLSKDKGFICVLGSTTVGEVNSNFILFDNFFDLLLNENIRNIGELVYKSKNKMPNIGEFTTSINYCFSILGDPLININIDTIPDLFITNNNINVTVENTNNNFIKETDSSVNITAILYNAGIINSTPFKIKLTHIYEEEEKEYIISFNEFCKKEEIKFTLPIKNKPGYHYFTIEVDANNDVYETRKDNNIINSKFYVYKLGLLPVEPLAYWNMKTNNLKFRQINQLFNEQSSYLYEFQILKVNNQDTLIIKSSSIDEINEYENYVDWTPDLTLENNKNYILASQLIDKNTENQSGLLYIPFNTYSSLIDNNTTFALKHSSELASLTLENMMITPETETDSSASITLLDKKINYTIKAYTKDKAQRYCRIWLGDSIYVDGTASNRGFNIVIVPKTGINPVGKYYLFDTYNNTEHVIDLLNLLQDSVKTNEYLIIATSDRSFNAFSKKQLDSLKKLLNSFGSKYIDDVSEWSAFAMIGWKNADKDSIIEKHILSDTAKLEGNLTFYTEEGKCQTLNIGPAKKWKELQINGDFSSNDVISNIEVVGINKEKEEIILLKKDTIGSIDLSNIDANDYPYIKVKFISKRNNILYKHYINSILLNYIPSAELTHNKNTHIEPTSILRADSADLILDISNISLRSTSTKSLVDLSFIGLQSSAINNIETEIPEIVPDNNIQILNRFDTEFFDASNLLKITIDKADNNNELYNFNNYLEIAPIIVYEDTIPPTMEIKIDNDIILNKDYITDEPVIEVRLFDNSNLSVTATEPLVVRINGIYQDKFNTKFYQSNVYETGNDIKADLKIIPQKLTDKENLFIFTSVDGSGNRDTTKYLLLISLNGYVNDLKTNPNPVSNNENMNFSFYFIANNNAKCNIDIYNLSGDKVKTITSDLTLRNNLILWDMKDEKGNLIPPGTYYYILTVNAEFWIEPKFGKFIFVK